MAEGEKHHYLPVFYLKQWAGSDGRLCQFSRPYDRVKPKRVHPDGTGYVRGLYAIDDMDPEIVNAIESKFLKPADGLAAETLQDLLNDRPFKQAARMRTSWSRFVLSLMVRYPEAIAEMKRQLTENVMKVYLETKKDDEPETFAEYEALRGTNELARLHGKLLMDLMQDSRMGRLIFGMHWGVVRFSHHKHDLLTSDRPVASNVFPISANHLCLPISPRHLFFACETERAEREFQQLDPKYIMQTSNDLMAKRAQAYVYGPDDSQLRFIQNRFGKSAATLPF
jgi:uncharacterized protein DUF4238